MELATPSKQTRRHITHASTHPKLPSVRSFDLI